MAISTGLSLVLSAGVVWWVVQFAAENPDKANLGSRVFNVGRADRLAKEVDDRGPFLFQDPLSAGTGRNLYIQHLGDDPEQGWSAIEARRPDDPGCVVQWDLDQEEFVDCQGATYPTDGEGLRIYAGTVKDNQIIIDLRTSTTTTTSPA